MKRFAFNLRALVVLRSHQEERAKEQFARAVHRYVEAEEQHAQTRQRVEALAGALNDHRHASFDATEAATMFRAFRAESAEEISSERRMIELRDAMLKDREAYFEAHRRLRLIKRLEERARERHQVELRRAEQANLDELASLRFGRQRVAL